MSKMKKSRESILKKLKIERLNSMQHEASLAIETCSDVVLLSPTGTGKTLAFLLPIIDQLDHGVRGVQVLILVPSRELAIQIEQVAREMGAGFKINCVYGGRPFSKDKLELSYNPAILIGTPGRVADHFRRGTVSTKNISILVLDEFDKSLEIGFEDEMSEIISSLKSIRKRVLTSATKGIEIPAFVGLGKPVFIDYLHEGVPLLDMRVVISPSKDKLETLVKLLLHIGNQPGIVFCNYKDTIERVSDYLDEKGISHGCYYGGLEQNDRERALIKFRNGTHQIIIATDLAARGLDIPEIRFIIHYHLPHYEKEFIHRNGRTARMNSEGIAYVLKWKDESLPDFIPDLEVEELVESHKPEGSIWSTVFVSGGRKDKISKGDIVGLFLKQGDLKNNQLGAIELKQDCAFVSVHASRVNHLIKMVNNSKLKKKKVRIKLV